MYCPKCKTEMKCPCSNCRLKNIDNKGEYWIFAHDDLIICGKCGYTEHIDIWQDIDYAQAKQGGDFKNKPV